MFLFKAYKLNLYIFLLLIADIAFASNYTFNQQIQSVNVVRQIPAPQVVMEEITFDFESEINTSHERLIEIETTNLKADIEIDIVGEDKEKFNYIVTESFDFRSGGVIFVSYAPDFDKQIHQALLTLSSEGAASKEFELIGVTKAISAVNNPSINNQVWVEKNKINFYACEGDVVELFSTTGQKVLQTTAVEGLNVIYVQVRGAIIMKIGNQSRKILM